ncbi:MAG: 30S ribosomal protein S12 methylthiotransferase RimO [Spirochaetales bacterium]|nr:30S ribosomal protein S12 methylthiotransferase RimO [Spirochaetales bacterium]
MKERTVYIESLGCAKNQVDSEKMAAVLEQHGWSIVDDSENAVCIIINTCGFIQSAKEEAVSVLFDAVKQKQGGKCSIVVAAGCFAQRYSDALKDEFSNEEIDVIFGIGDISKIADIVEDAFLNKQPTKRVVIPQMTDDNLLHRKLSGFPGSAYLRISDGCSNHCTYCAIPIIRGELHSRKIETILDELDLLLANGDIKELNVISQDTTNYGMDIYGERKLADLLEAIDNKLPDGTRMRLLYMHPDHITDELLDRMTKLRHFVPYFDLPFQSASKNVLQRMGRKGDTATYLKLLERIRQRFADAVIRSTFIVGFPGETAEDAAEALEFIKQAKMEWVGAFAYSPEEDTPAYDLPNRVKKNVAKKRLDKLMDVSEEIALPRLERFVGERVEVLIEERIDEELCIGRFWGQAPDVDGLTVVESANAVPGEMIDVEILRLNGKDFYGIQSVNN